MRGRFGSEGVFDPCAQEEADGADAVAWLAARPECDGAVGMWGASYASDTQFAALLGGAPALRALAPAMTPALSALDGFRFRGGVPELGSTLAWTHYAIAPDAIARVPSARERDAEHRLHEATEQAIATGEAYRAGALHEQRDAEGIVRWGLDRLREPLDSPRHRAGKIVDRLDAVDVPVLLTGGWFDVFLGPTLELYRRLRRRAEDMGGRRPGWSWARGRTTTTPAGPRASTSARRRPPRPWTSPRCTCAGSTRCCAGVRSAPRWYRCS